MAAKPKKPKKRTLYLIEWYDIEGDAGWGEGAEAPPLVVQPAFIVSWPRKNQAPPCYRIANAYAETEAGGTSIIPAGVVKGKPQAIAEITMRYR
jgi:hypothetical protein